MKRNIRKEGKTYLQHVHAWPFLMMVDFVRSELIVVSELVVPESRGMLRVVVGLIAAIWIGAYLINSEKKIKAFERDR